MTDRPIRDELNPITSADELPTGEVGDVGSFEAEPEGGYPDAPEPETEDHRLPFRPIGDLDPETSEVEE